jgi:prevent-host-death family protein
MAHVKTVTISYAKAKLDALLAAVERTSEPVTITYHGRPVAVLTPVHKRARVRPASHAGVPDSFDDSVPDAESAAWDGNFTRLRHWLKYIAGQMFSLSVTESNWIVG